MSKRGSYIGGHTLVGPHTGWFSGVGGKRKAKKPASKRGPKKAVLLAEAEAEREATRMERRQANQERVAKLPEAEESALLSRRTRARMSTVEVVRKTRSQPVLKLK
jgi:hypothetical protein